MTTTLPETRPAIGRRSRRWLGTGPLVVCQDDRHLEAMTGAIDVVSLSRSWPARLDALLEIAAERSLVIFVVREDSDFGGRRIFDALARVAAFSVATLPPLNLVRRSRLGEPASNLVGELLAMVEVAVTNGQYLDRQELEDGWCR